MATKKFNLSSIFTSFIIMTYLIVIGFAERNADLLQIGFAAIWHYWLIVLITIFELYRKQNQHYINQYFDLTLGCIALTLVLASVL